MAGAPCPIEVMKRVNSEMNMREVTIAYGMTETSPVSFQSAVDDPLERRVSTVGRIHPHVEVKVVDLDGKIVPRGERGELCTRGYSVMLGYWDEAEKTAEVLDANGWMHTGDLAIIDDEGYCNIVGRIKDMVIRGGENLYPREIEEFLYRHPKIQDVQIFGVADDRYGEELCAWIRVTAGRDADDGGGARLLPRPDRAQQDPALRRIRRRVSDDRDRQDPEIPDARGGGATARTEGGEDGVRLHASSLRERGEAIREFFADAQVWIASRYAPRNDGREPRALHRQPALLRQLLQRHLRPRADVLDHFGGRERAELAACS